MSRVSRAYTSIEMHNRRVLEKYFRENSPCIRSCAKRKMGCHGKCEEEKAYLESFNELKDTLMKEGKNQGAIIEVLYSSKKGERYGKN